MMLSLDRCREILKSANYELETEEIRQLRDFLIQIATLQVEAECEAENNEIQNLVA